MLRKAQYNGPKLGTGVGQAGDLLDSDQLGYETLDGLEAQNLVDTASQQHAQAHITSGPLFTVQSGGPRDGPFAGYGPASMVHEVFCEHSPAQQSGLLPCVCCR